MKSIDIARKDDIEQCPCLRCNYDGKSPLYHLYRCSEATSFQGDDPCSIDDLADCPVVKSALKLYHALEKQEGA